METDKDYMKKMIWLLAAVMSLARGTMATELLSNGGFESGSTGWSLSGNWDVKSDRLLAHSGTNYLSLQTVHDGTFRQWTNSQSFQLPDGTQELYADFYLNIYRTDGKGTVDGELAVYVVDSIKQSKITLLELYNGSNNIATRGNYTYRGRFNLTAFANQSSGYLQLQLVVSSGAIDALVSGNTEFNIDDFRVTAVTASDRPKNDSFAGRMVIPGGMVTARTNWNLGASNIFASWEAGETNHGGKTAKGGSSVWWSYTAGTNGTLSINTTNAGFNSILAVYTGDALGSLTLVKSNVDTSSGYTGAKVSFQALMGTEYSIAVDGTNGAQGYFTLNLDMAADTNKPVVSITYPANGRTVSNSAVTALGKASDAFWLNRVEYRLHNAVVSNAYQLAQTTNGWTNWSAPLTGLHPGTNTLWVRAYDENGNVSVETRSQFTYVVYETLRVGVSGLGSIKPAAYTNTVLMVAKPYTVTAAPAKGWILSNWTDGGGVPLTNGVSLKFTMVSNLVLNANFVTNPFIATKGSYAGLFLPEAVENIAFTNAGYVSATVTDKGALSAKLQVGGAAYSLSGALSPGGYYSNSIARKAMNPLNVQLQLDLNGAGTLTGTVFSAGWKAPASLWADRAVYSKTNPAPQALNKYTMILVNRTNVTAAPGDYSVGALSADVSGNLKFSGTLSDGTKATQSSVVSQYNQWPMYLSLYSGKGAVMGWLNVSNTPDTGSAGLVSWLKPTASGKIYPTFNLNGELDAFLSRYVYSNKVAVLNLTDPMIVLDQGNLDSALTNFLSWSSNNVVTATNKLSLKLTAATGLFQGAVPRMVNGKAVSIPVNGVVMQNLNAGFGSFLGTSQSGRVQLLSQ
jgi:hypothetical protein